MAVDWRGSGLFRRAPIILFNEPIGLMSSWVKVDRFSLLYVLSYDCTTIDTTHQVTIAMRDDLIYSL